MSLPPPLADARARAQIRAALFSAIGTVPGVVSVSLVGSFCESPDLTSISDIDTVVVVETLTPAVFAQLRAAVLALTGADLGLPGSSVRLNDTFGPRKFDSPTTVVVHLMVYDRAGHRDHVLKSPFTCYDWERTEIAGRKALAEVYPVAKLQARDFFYARRGLQNYLQDLDAGTLSYRYYNEAPDGRLRQLEASHPLDARHAGEYALHIMKSLVGNYAKLLTGQNCHLSTDELCTFWAEQLLGCAEFVPFYRTIEAVKRSRRSDFPSDTVERVRSFLTAYCEEINRHWNQEARQLTFYRHAPTAANDGSFLGQGRDPGILPTSEIAPLPTPVDVVYTSPLRRAVETAVRLCPRATLARDARLAEIDYGQAEGLTFAALRDKHPSVTDAWARGEDPRFPDGENTTDVVARLRCFLDACARSGTRTGAVVTHNVVLRALIGSQLGWPMRDWHRLKVPHVTPVELRWFRGRYYLDLEPALREQVLDTLAGWQSPRYAVA